MGSLGGHSCVQCQIEILENIVWKGFRRLTLPRSECGGCIHKGAMHLWQELQGNFDEFSRQMWEKTVFEHIPFGLLIQNLALNVL